MQRLLAVLAARATVLATRLAGSSAAFYFLTCFIITHYSKLIKKYSSFRIERSRILVIIIFLIFIIFLIAVLTLTSPTESAKAFCHNLT